MKNSLSFLLIGTFCLLLNACSGQTKESANTEKETTTQEVKTPVYEVLDVDAFKTELSKGEVKFIDVRTPKEFAAGHIEGATNINVLDGDFKMQIQEFCQAGDKVMLYCKSGKRSARASKVLKELGYQQIYDLDGGYLAWSKNNE